MVAYIIFTFGMAVAVVSGYLGYGWWFIFIAAAIILLGNAINRPQLLLENRNNLLFWVKYLVYSVLGNAIVTGPLYGLGYLLRSLTN